MVTSFVRENSVVHNSSVVDKMRIYRLPIALVFAFTLTAFAQSPVKTTTLVICAGRTGIAHLRTPDGKIVDVPVPKYPSTAINHHWEGTGFVQWENNQGMASSDGPWSPAFGLAVIQSLQHASFPKGTGVVVVPYVFTLKRCEELRK